MREASTPFERVLDWVAAAVAGATFFDMLPSIAALFTIVWTGIRIYETATIQRLFGRKGPGGGL